MKKIVDIKCHQQFPLKAFYSSSGFCMELDGAFHLRFDINVLEFSTRARKHI